MGLDFDVSAVAVITVHREGIHEFSDKSVPEPEHFILPTETVYDYLLRATKAQQCTSLIPMPISSFKGCNIFKPSDSEIFKVVEEYQDRQRLEHSRKRKADMESAVVESAVNSSSITFNAPIHYRCKDYYHTTDEDDEDNGKAIWEHIANVEQLPEYKEASLVVLQVSADSYKGNYTACTNAIPLYYLADMGISIASCSLVLGCSGSVC